MLLLNCPNCGSRNVSEFRFGGESNPRPREPMLTSDAKWNDFLYLREDKQGVQTEWWYHRAGCGLWFLAERHTYTSQVLKTYLWQDRDFSQNRSK